MSDKIINEGIRFSRPMTIEQVSKSVYPGWENLICSMLEDLFQLGWDGRLLQIKEKFGALRVYLDKSNDVLNARVLQAESESYKSCRDCGEPGKLRSEGWLKVVCDQHASEDE